jgi:hypothetical protein
MNRLVIARPVLHAVSAALLIVAGAAAARAEAISYSLTFCENLDVLKDPTNEILMDNASKLSQHTLMMQRTNPYFELRNTSEQASITQFSLSIGDLSKNFDWAKMIEASPGVTVNVTSVDDMMGGLSSDMLVISFTGFTPGSFVRFRFGIGSDSPDLTFIQDYRKTLFNLDGSDTSDNALVTVDFKSGDATEQLVDQLPNFSMNGLTTATDMSFPSGPCFDHVLPFNFQANGSIDPVEPGPQVPEPGSVVLLGLGLVGLVGWKLRRRS